MRVSLIISLIFLGMSPCHANSIRSVEDAGIYCDGEAAETIPFYSTARRACEGHQSCVVSATDVAPLKEMVAHHCTGFFVNIRCQGGHQYDLESRTSLTRRLLVECR